MNGWEHMASKSKIITAAFKIEEIKSDSLFPEFSNQSSPEQIRDQLLEKYESSVGILDGFIEEDQVILQWFPENTDGAAEDLHFQATKYAKQKNYTAAVENWKNASHLNPNDVEYLYKIGLVLFEMKSFLEAIRYLEKAVSICPIHARAHLILGMSWTKLRKFESAEQSIKESLKLNKSNLLSYLNLGAVYTVRKKFREAIEVFENALRKYPNESRAHLGLAKVFTAQGDTINANEHYRKVIELAPKSAMAEYAKKSLREIHSDLDDIVQEKEDMTDDSLLDHGFNLYIQNKHDLAANEYKQYLKNKPSDDYVWYLYGETKLRSGHLDEATDCFKRSLRLNDKRGLYYKMLGITLYYSGKGEECMQVLKKAIELGKDDSITQTLLGICYLQKKQEDVAINIFKQALKSFSNNYLALYNYAMASIKKSDYEKARELLDKVINQKNETPVKQSARKLMQSIES